MHGYGVGLSRGLMGFSSMHIGGIVMFIILAIVVGVLIYFALKKGKGSGIESPLSLLKKRFVNGEISNEEYLEKKEILKK